MKRTIDLVLACVAVLVAAGQVEGAIVGVAGGTAAPSATLGSFTMTPFLDDTRPVYSDVTTVASPLGGDLVFSAAVNLREIGNGWATWSHGYTGDVYYSNGLRSVSIQLPASTGAFYLYAEPNPFALHEIVATTSGGASVSQSVEGASGAAYFGFYTTDQLDPIVSVTVSSPTTDFAFGEFGIAQVDISDVPEPLSLAIWGCMGGLGMVIGAVRRRQQQAA